MLKSEKHTLLHFNTVLLYIELKYILILQGDVNGDSAVDVLDAMQVQKASTGKEELTDNYLLAADTDYDGTVSVMDYAQVVNLAVDS